MIQDFLLYHASPVPCAFILVPDENICDISVLLHDYKSFIRCADQIFENYYA